MGLKNCSKDDIWEANILAIGQCDFFNGKTSLALYIFFLICFCNSIQIDSSVLLSDGSFLRVDTSADRLHRKYRMKEEMPVREFHSDFMTDLEIY